MNHLLLTVAFLTLGLLYGCTSVSGVKPLNADRCTDEIVEVVQRFEHSPIDTMVTVRILGRANGGTTIQRDLSACSSACTTLVADSMTTHAYLPSKALACVSKLPWIDRIELSPTPLPLPVDKGQ